MRPVFTKQFDQSYAGFPKSIQEKFDKQLRSLLGSLNHRSLHAKKYHETQDVWQARIDRHYRFYFKIKDDTYTILAIKHHTD